MANPWDNDPIVSTRAHGGKIDPSHVKWDPIDPSQVQWDDARPDFSNVQTTVSNGHGNSLRTGRTDTGIANLIRGRRQYSSGHEPNPHEIDDDASAFVSGAYHRSMDALHGSAQGIQHGINWALGKLPDNPISRYWDRTTQSDDAALAQRESDYKSTRPDYASANVGEVVGTMLPWMFGRPATAGTKLTGFLAPQGSGLLRRALATGATGAAMGTASGASSPVTSGDYSQQKRAQVEGGAIIGGLAPIVPAGGRAALNLARPLVRPILSPGLAAAENMARMFGLSDEGAVRNAISKLSGNHAIVPGEAPTTAQVLGGTEPAMADKALRNNPAYRPMFEAADQHNNAARVSVINRLAGTDADLAAAVNARRANAAPFTSRALTPGAENQRFQRAADSISQYMQGRQIPAAETKVLEQARRVLAQAQSGKITDAQAMTTLSMLQPKTPGGQAALAQARAGVDANMVKVGGIRLTLNQLAKSGNPIISGAARRHLSLLDQHADARDMVPAYALEDMRQNIGSMLANHAPNGVVPSQVAALYQPVSRQIIRAVDKSVPGYRGYIANWRADSAPINTMQAARQMVGKLDQARPGADGQSILTLGQVNRGLASVDRSRYGVTPDARQALEGVRQSLRRQEAAQAIRSPGSDTAYNLQAQGALARNFFGPTYGGTTGLGQSAVTTGLAGLGFSMGGPSGALAGMTLSAAVRKVANGVNKRVMDQYALGLVRPEQAASQLREYLATLKPSEAEAVVRMFPQWGSVLYGNGVGRMGDQQRGDR